MLRHTDFGVKERRLPTEGQQLSVEASTVWCPDEGSVCAIYYYPYNIVGGIALHARER